MKYAGLIALGLFGSGFLVRGFVAIHNGTQVVLKGRGGPMVISPAAAIEIGCLVVAAAVFYAFTGNEKTDGSPKATTQDKK